MNELERRPGRVVMALPVLLATLLLACDGGQSESITTNASAASRPTPCTFGKTVQGFQERHTPDFRRPSVAYFSPNVRVQVSPPTTETPDLRPVRQAFGSFDDAFAQVDDSIFYVDEFEAGNGKPPVVVAWGGRGDEENGTIFAVRKSEGDEGGRSYIPIATVGDDDVTCLRPGGSPGVCEGLDIALPPKLIEFGSAFRLVRHSEFLQEFDKDSGPMSVDDARSILRLYNAHGIDRAATMAEAFSRLDSTDPVTLVPYRIGPRKYTLVRWGRGDTEQGGILGPDGEVVQLHNDGDFICKDI